eukprot:13639098-Ditylum_brightwellii.AAC.1
MLHLIGPLLRGGDLIEKVFNPEMKWALNHKQVVVATGGYIRKSTSVVGVNLACYRIVEIHCACKDH